MTEERANEVERLVEKIGLGTNTRMGNFICEVKSNIAREHINFQNTAEEIDRLGECVKNLERENDILKQENAQIKARLDALEKLLLE
jgi:regulator of replication initiation timing